MFCVLMMDMIAGKLNTNIIIVNYDSFRDKTMELKK